MVVLLKSSTRCTSDGTTSSSVRGALERLLVVVDTMVVEILMVGGVLFTKNWRIWEFEESHKGVRSCPNRASMWLFKPGPSVTALPVWE